MNLTLNLSNFTMTGEPVVTRCEDLSQAVVLHQCARIGPTLFYGLLLLWIGAVALLVWASIRRVDDKTYAAACYRYVRFVVAIGLVLLVYTYFVTF